MAETPEPTTPAFRRVLLKLSGESFCRDGESGISMTEVASVSEQIKNALVESCSDDIAVCPVTLRKIGKREAKLPPPIPSTGEPEDIIDEVPILKDTSEIGPYFEVLILKESAYPPGCTPTSICAGCNRPDVDSSTRELRMNPEMWKGDNIFFLATTLYVVITNEVMERVARDHPTNVVFEEI